MLDPKYLFATGQYFLDGFLIDSSTGAILVVNQVIDLIGCFEIPNATLSNNFIEKIRIVRNSQRYCYPEPFMVYCGTDGILDGCLTYIKAFEKLGYIPPINLFYRVGKIPQDLIPLAKETIIAYRKHHLEESNYLLQCLGIKTDLPLALSEAVLNGDVAAEAALHDLEEEMC